MLILFYCPLLQLVPLLHEMLSVLLYASSLTRDRAAHLLSLTVDTRIFFICVVHIRKNQFSEKPLLTNVCTEHHVRIPRKSTHERIQLPPCHENPKSSTSNGPIKTSHSSCHIQSSNILSIIIIFIKQANLPNKRYINSRRRIRLQLIFGIQLPHKCSELTLWQRTSLFVVITVQL